MGDHHVNGRALAAAAGRPVPQQTRVLELGDGVVCAGFSVQPMIRPASDEEGAPLVMVAMLVAAVGKVSPLSLSADLKQLPICEIGGVPVDAIKQALAANEAPTEKPAA